MNLTDSVALVTGANRGLGARLVAELLRAGAATVYATSRSGGPTDPEDPRVRSLALDVTDPASVAAAVAAAPDVNVLVNNAGVLAFGSALDGDLADFERDLRPRGISVLGAYPGGIDTDMLAGVTAPKAPPELVASRIVSALAAGETVVFPDDASAASGAIYLSDPLKLEEMLAG